MLSVRLAVPSVIPYPKAAIVAGVEACGFRFVTDNDPADVLITWSPWLGTHREGETRRHRIVIVVENGWWTPIEGKTHYQVALNGFNGQGVFFPEGDMRPFPLQERPSLCWDRGPWLVVGQRGGAGDPRMMPEWWPEKAAARLLSDSGQRALIHPKGSGETPRQLLERIRPRSVVTWSSNFASWALWYGVPVFYCGPSSMVQEIARRWHENLTAPEPYQVDSSQVESLFRKLVWAQWTAEEICSGYPFAKLLNMKRTVSKGRR